MHQLLNLIEYVICFALWGVLLASCDSGPEKVEILTYNEIDDIYEYRVVELTTLDDIDAMSGQATALYGGISMELDYSKGEVRWNRIGRPVAFGGVKVGGVVYPEDFSSMAMAAIYYNIEQAMKFFDQLGLEPGTLGDLPTYYWADIKEIGDVLSPFSDGFSKDNAFYLAVDEKDRGFYVLPFDQIDLLPLSMNLGVMTHEYSHAVFQHFVYDRIGGREDDLPETTYNYLYAFNEGFADTMAVGLTGDADYMAHSTGNDISTRDASRIIYYQRWFDVSATNEVAADYFNPYEIGSFLSSVMYQIALRASVADGGQGDRPTVAARREICRAVLAVWSTIDSLDIPLFEPNDFFESFLKQLSPSRRKIACQVLSIQYTIHYDKLEGCGG